VGRGKNRVCGKGKGFNAGGLLTPRLRGEKIFEEGRKKGLVPAFAKYQMKKGRAGKMRRHRPSRLWKNCRGQKPSVARMQEGLSLPGFGAGSLGRKDLVGNGKALSTGSGR